MNSLSFYWYLLTLSNVLAPKKSRFPVFVPSLQASCLSCPVQWRATRNSSRSGWTCSTTHRCRRRSSSFRQYLTSPRFLPSPSLFPTGSNGRWVEFVFIDDCLWLTEAPENLFLLFWVPNSLDLKIYIYVCFVWMRTFPAAVFEKLHSEFWFFSILWKTNVHRIRSEGVTCPDIAPFLDGQCLIAVDFYSLLCPLR